MPQNLTTFDGQLNYKENVNYYATTNTIPSENHLRAWRKDNYAFRTYQCSLCSYRCFQKCDLVKHERVHTGERPYKCQICSYCSSQLSSLRRHQRVHLKEKRL